nr:aldehyde dehydrogenase family protein [Bacteroidota bacterium]
MHLKIDQTLQAQRDFFNTYQTRDIRFRINQLKTLRRAIIAHEDQLYDAFWKDLHKSKFEAYSSEIGLVLNEISLHIRKLRSWARPERVPTDQLIHFWSTSRI